MLVGWLDFLEKQENSWNAVPALNKSMDGQLDVDSSNRSSRDWVVVSQSKTQSRNCYPVGAIRRIVLHNKKTKYRLVETENSRRQELVLIVSDGPSHCRQSRDDDGFSSFKLVDWQLLAPWLLFYLLIIKKENWPNPKMVLIDDYWLWMYAPVKLRYNNAPQFVCARF